MRLESVLLLALACGGATAALAGDLPPPSLPMLAADPDAASPWKGLYAGTEFFAIGGSHGKGAVGGAGTLGYSHEFDNRLVVGIEGVSGLARGSFGRGGINGFDYLGTNVRVGYDLGRVMPYVFAGVDVARPTFRGAGGFGNAGDSINDLFSGSARLRTLTTVGAGVDYAITNRLTVGLSVSAVQSHGGVGPYGPFGPTFP